MKRFDNNFGGNGKISDWREFNEGLIFELYKEKPFDSAKDMKRFIYKMYGIIPSYDLICAITNYQIRKYGCVKRSGHDITNLLMERNNRPKSFERRMKNKQRQRDEAQTKRVIRNSEKRLKEKWKTDTKK